MCSNLGLPLLVLSVQVEPMPSDFAQSVPLQEFKGIELKKKKRKRKKLKIIGGQHLEESENPSHLALHNEEGEMKTWGGHLQQVPSGEPGGPNSPQVCDLCCIPWS